MSIADKLTTIADNQQRVYDAGKTFAENQCALKHFTADFYGNDQYSYTINIPFEPDMIIVYGFDPMLLVGQNQAFFFAADLRAFGLAGGYNVVHTTGQNVYPQMNTSKSVLTRYSRDNDGNVTLTNMTAPVGTETVKGLFSSTLKYTIIAYKYTDKTDQELMTEFISSLSDSESGSLTFNKDKVNAAFTDAEWNALIATKPKWTFTLF